MKTFSLKLCFLSFDSTELKIMLILRKKNQIIVHVFVFVFLRVIILIFKLNIEEWSTDKNIVSKIEFECLQMIFVLPQFTIQGHLQYWGHRMFVHENSFQRKQSKISDMRRSLKFLIFKSKFAPFSSLKILSTYMPCWVL